jgi:hypothetical protein
MLLQHRFVNVDGDVEVKPYALQAGKWRKKENGEGR